MLSEIRSRLTWLPGRQGGGYFKLPLLKRTWFDAYLIKYPPGSSIQPHVDPVPGRRHYRLNIVLKRPTQGGQLHLKGRPLLRFWRVNLFRPDLCEHGVSTVLAGYRLVLSVGVALKS